jgi:hypothetical protein
MVNEQGGVTNLETVDSFEQLRFLFQESLDPSFKTLVLFYLHMHRRFVVLDRIGT